VVRLPQDLLDAHRNAALRHADVGPKHKAIRHFSAFRRLQAGQATQLIKDAATTSRLHGRYWSMSTVARVELIATRSGHERNRVCAWNECSTSARMLAVNC
jgi:hypothetical protein